MPFSGNKILTSEKQRTQRKALLDRIYWKKWAMDPVMVYFGKFSIFKGHIRKPPECVLRADPALLNIL